MPALALLYDVHGNLPALEAVLADARDVGAERFVLGGDYALFGPWPAETVAALRALADAVWIRGNGERWTASPWNAPEDETVQGAIAACREALGPDLVAELGGLPEQAVVGQRRICHGSPRSDVRSFAPEPGDDDELLDGAREPVVIFGHTHLPFTREGPGGVQLINPGSVGMPFDGDPRASFAVLHPDARIEHRRVTYDHEASATALAERFGAAGWTETVARRLLTARP